MKEDISEGFADKEEEEALTAGTLKEAASVPLLDDSASTEVGRSCVIV